MTASGKQKPKPSNDSGQYRRQQSVPQKTHMRHLRTNRRQWLWLRLEYRGRLLAMRTLFSDFLARPRDFGLKRFDARIQIVNRMAVELLANDNITRTGSLPAFIPIHDGLTSAETHDCT